MEKREKRRPSRYWKFLGFFALLNIIVIFLVMQVVYIRLLAYEAGTPNTALRDFFRAVTSGDIEAARRDAGYEDAPPEEREIFDERLLELYGGRNPEELQYRRIASSDPDGRIVYAVYEENEKLGEVYMYSSAGETSGAVGSVDELLEATDGEAPSWRIVTPIEIDYLPPVTITAPDYVAVYVNGDALSPDDAVDAREGETTLFERLPQGYTVTLPKTFTYEIEGFLREPQVEAAGADGEPVSLTYDEEKRHYETATTLGRPVTSDEWNEFSARVTDAAKAYALFISRDGSLYTLNQHLYPGTDFAARMAGFDNQWYGSHSSYEFSGLEVTEVSKYADDVFVGRIKFDFVVNFYSGQRTFNSNYTMIFVRSGTRWLLADLQVL